MRSALILTAIAAVAYASVADAKSCKDAKGHFAKCSAATAAHAKLAPAARTKVATTSPTGATTWGSHCVVVTVGATDAWVRCPSQLSPAGKRGRQ
jgi:hypothetical protein